ncbi:hypothetical protein GCM10027047_04450 [Rhodococcus aerolatus]
MTDLPPSPDDPRPGGSDRVRSGSWDDDPRAFPGWAAPAPAPAHPPAPSPARAPAARRGPDPAPAEVVLSAQLWWASIALGLVAGLLSILLVDRDALVTAVLDADTSGLTRSQAESAVGAGLVGGLVLTVVLLAVEGLLVRRMRQGRRWARTTLTVLGVVSVLFSLLGVSAGLTLSGLANLVSLLLVASAVWLMHRPAAADHFARPAP